MASKQTKPEPIFTATRLINTKNKLFASLSSYDERTHEGFAGFLKVVWQNLEEEAKDPEGLQGDYMEFLCEVARGTYGDDLAIARMVALAVETLPVPARDWESLLRSAQRRDLPTGVSGVTSNDQLIALAATRLKK